jgi:hypothetical protein
VIDRNGFSQRDHRAFGDRVGGDHFGLPALAPDPSYCTGSKRFCSLRGMLETSLYPVVK